MTERTDIGYRLALWVCRIFGHRWQQWTKAGDERCHRCLRWKHRKPMPGPPFDGRAVGKWDGQTREEDGSIKIQGVKGWYEIEAPHEMGEWAAVWYRNDLPGQERRLAVRAVSSRWHCGSGSYRLYFREHIMAEAFSENARAVKALARLWSLATDRESDEPDPPTGTGSAPMRKKWAPSCLPYLGPDDGQ